MHTSSPGRFLGHPVRGPHPKLTHLLCNTADDRPIDTDDPDDLQWLFVKAKERAEEFNISVCTFFLFGFFGLMPSAWLTTSLVVLTGERRTRGHVAIDTLAHRQCASCCFFIMLESKFKNIPTLLICNALVVVFIIMLDSISTKTFRARTPPRLL